MPDLIFYLIGVAEAALILTVLGALGRYDRDHPATP
jgi:hypothetical protein